VAKKKEKRSLKGYHEIFRDRFNYLTDPDESKRLTIQELMVYELGIALCNWEYSDEIFDTKSCYRGSFKASIQELADLLGLSKSYIHEIYRSLVAKEFFTENHWEKGRTKCKDFEKWVKPRRAKKLNRFIR